MSEPVARVLSLGAGVQSSCLALMSARGDYDLPALDIAVFADTQAEPESVYTWLEQLTALVQESARPFPIYTVTQGSLEDDQLRVRHRKADGVPYVRNAIPAFVVKPDGNWGLLGRRCTTDFKIRPFHRAVRKRLGVYNKKTPAGWRVEAWLGISTDEAHRMKPARDHWVEHRWPLIELGLNRSDCIRYAQSLGFEPPRSACVFCPFHGRDEWQRLQQDEPEAYERACRFEERLQAVVAQDPGTYGVPYLTKTGQMLRDIDWDNTAHKDRAQLDLFGNECEGMCGI